MERIAITGASGFVGRHVLPPLVASGYHVTAFVRSPEAARRVQEIGCQAALCDLSQMASVARHLEGADALVHMAARLDIWGTYRDFYCDNVLLTRRMLEASEKVGIKAFVMIGAAAVAIGSPDPFPLNEHARLIEKTAGHYGTTKALAEKEVLLRESRQMRRLVLRPPLIWAQDAPVFDSIAEAIRKRQFVWIDGGRYHIATIHVENLISAILAALSSPAGQGVYFVSDGEYVQFRELVEAALRVKGVPGPRLSVPRSVAKPSAALVETAWGLLRLPGRPPITRALVDLIGGEFRIDDARARKEIGYRNRISIHEGLSRFADQANA